MVCFFAGQLYYAAMLKEQKIKSSLQLSYDTSEDTLAIKVVNDNVITIKSQKHRDFQVNIYLLT